jgi:hypothetical protein
MKDSIVNNIFKINQREPVEGDIKVSYSQFSMYSTCPKQWEITYKQKVKDDKPSIHLVFGTAMHEVIQHWLDTMYKKSITEANNLPLTTMLLDIMKREYVSLKEQCGCDFSNQSEMREFFEDGVEILNYIIKHRLSYFNTKQMNLLGIELPIYHKPINGYNVNLMGFIDLIFEDTYDNSIVIYDIKTSTSGWNKWQKSDKTKLSQLILYKKYFSEQYGYPVDKINVEYFIVKRKLNENNMFTQSRVQMFSPANGSVTLKRVENEFTSFIKTAFNSDGSFNENSEFPATTNGGKSCRFCPFKDNFELCPKENRI